MPLPPPPAAALIRTGYPIVLAFLGSVVIGKVGTPAFCAISLAFSLSPIEVITLELGPTQIRPALITSLENFAFSERKPYPGCIA